jgi:lipoprotein-anchoring transpeptidase ErfK/SrfK
VRDNAPDEEVANIKVDKKLSAVLGYAADGKLIVSYPATIGSGDTQSPEGDMKVKGVAENPTYSYRPEKNFQQGNNTEPLELPPGPNNPVGTVWIDLTKPTYGIHGTPDPDKIGKTASHGCVRLTNWDAEQLAKLVKPGVEVSFVNGGQ